LALLASLAVNFLNFAVPLSHWGGGQIMNHGRVSFQIACVAAGAMLLAITLWSPLYPREQWLQHVPTAIALPALLLAAKRGWLSDLSMVCLSLMLGLHILGARWIYSYVPYEQWCDAAIGSGPGDWFGWTRNHYDRLVHLAFGLLMTLPLAETARRYARVSAASSLAFAWLAVAGVSAVYEVLEWALAVIAAPDFAEKYNGQQGDFWDAQKDMALAMAGSSLAAAGMAVVGRP
jgi:putative membrane protein